MNWIVNNDQFGASCIQIHAAVPEIHTADVRQREHIANVALSLDAEIFSCASFL